MQTVSQQLRQLCLEAVKQAYPDVSIDDYQNLMEVTRATQEEFGHYQCNAAMKLAKILRQPPRVIAEKMAEELKQGDSSSVIKKLDVAGPGFLNITLSPTWVAQKLEQQLIDADKLLQADEKQKIVVDLSSPNIAKEMHVGHLRSTIIGDTLARLFEKMGHDVLRLNHVGDWGTSFGMLIAYIQSDHPDFLNKEENTTLSELVAWYRQAKVRFDANEQFRKEAKEAVVSLQSGGKEERAIWKKICALSRLDFEKIYQLLDVKLTERGESFYNDTLAPMVEELNERNLLEESDGAQCLFLPGFTGREGAPLPFMLRKSDGGFNYSATDLAALKQRTQEEGADRLIYVVDAGQATHFSMLFAAAEKVGYSNSETVRLDHVPFGLVLGADGKKFRTRSGDTEPLMGLLKTAIEKAGELLEERGFEAEGREELAHRLGIAAVKYADLVSNRVQDYTFSYDRMLRFEGNTAIFLLYAYVRIQGIFRKIGQDPDELVAEEQQLHLNHPSEIALALELIRYPEILETMAEDLMPHRLADYLYGLAQKFNAFFRDCRVEGSDEQTSRLLLAEATARVLRSGLEILGIGVVDRM